MTKPDSMKCLSVKQPLARLLVIGCRNTMHVAFHTTYRGPLLIHAGNHVNEFVMANIVKHGYMDSPLATGAIVGRVTLASCHCNWDSPGKYEWHVESPEEFMEPVVWYGHRRLGLFDVPSNIVSEAKSRRR